MTHHRYCVVGAGIVGLSTAYHLLRNEPDADVVVLEAAGAPATHQTGHNSGVIHSGIYYEPGSLKARFCKAGERATKQFCVEHGIDFDECGKLIVATDEAELTRMAALQNRAAVNGIECHRVSAGELVGMEPRVTGLGALHLPRTGIVDYRRIAATLAGLITTDRGALHTGAKVLSLHETPSRVTVSTATRTVTCEVPLK